MSKALTLFTKLSQTDIAKTVRKRLLARADLKKKHTSTTNKELRRYVSKYGKEIAENKRRKVIHGYARVGQ